MENMDRFTVYCDWAGWDQSTGRVTLDDEWWDRLKKPDIEKYSKYRKRGVEPELSDLWDDVFTQKVAVGKHVISPNMDSSSVLVYNIEAASEVGLHVLAIEGCPNKRKDFVEVNDNLAELLEKDTIDDNGSFRDILHQVRVDASFEDVLASMDGPT